MKWQEKKIIFVSKIKNTLYVTDMVIYFEKKMNKRFGSSCFHRQIFMFSSKSRVYLWKILMKMCGFSLFHSISIGTYISWHCIYQEPAVALYIDMYLESKDSISIRPHQITLPRLILIYYYMVIFVLTLVCAL